MEAVWDLVVVAFVVTTLGTASIAFARIFGVGAPRTR